MEKSKPSSTPTTLSYNLCLSMSPQTMEELSYICRVRFTNHVGCMMYVMVCTWPNIVHALLLVGLWLDLRGNSGKG